MNSKEIKRDEKKATRIGRVEDEDLQPSRWPHIGSAAGADDAAERASAMALMARTCISSAAM